MRKLLIPTILLLCACLCGCEKEADSTVHEVNQNVENSVYIYYPKDNNVLMSQEYYQLKQPDSIVHSVEEVMSVSLEYYDGKIENYSYMVDEDDNVTVDITISEDCTREYCLLTMSAVSDTLFQVDMVGGIKITLLAEDGDVIDSKLILRSTFFHYDSDREGNVRKVNFYKVSDDKEHLEALRGTVVLDDNVSVVENVVVKLEEINAIPKGTKVNSVSIISKVCYIDLSEEFTGNVEDVKSELVVYSLVNSIAGLNYVDEVMITIDRKVETSYRGTVDLSKPLSYNKDILD